MKVEKIDHIHAYAKDLEGAVRLFADLLGKEFLPVWESDDFGARAAFHPLGFEFLQPTDPNGPVAQTIGTREEGILFVCFKVPDIEEAIAEMEWRGIKMIHQYQVGKLKEALFESTNTFGVQIELCEYPGDDITAASVASH